MRYQPEEDKWDDLEEEMSKDNNSIWKGIREVHKCSHDSVNKLKETNKVLRTNIDKLNERVTFIERQLIEASIKSKPPT